MWLETKRDKKICRRKKGKRRKQGETGGKKKWWRDRELQRESTGEIERNRERESIDNIFIIYIYTHTNIHPYFCRI